MFATGKCGAMVLGLNSQVKGRVAQPLRPCLHLSLRCAVMGEGGAHRISNPAPDALRRLCGDDEIAVATRAELGAPAMAADLGVPDA